MIDSTGTIAWALLPWHIIIPALTAGGVSLISSLLSGESIGQSILNGISGASIAAFIAAYPSLAFVVTSVDYLLLLVDCLYEGKTFEESLVIIGFTTVSNTDFFSTDDGLADMVFDSTFGTAKELMCTIGENVAVSGEASAPNRSAVTCGIFSLFTISSSGGGCLGMTTICFDAFGGQSLCYRP